MKHSWCAESPQKPFDYSSKYKPILKLEHPKKRHNIFAHFLIHIFLCRIKINIMLLMKHLHQFLDTKTYQNSIKWYSKFNRISFHLYFELLTSYNIGEFKQIIYYTNRGQIFHTFHCKLWSSNLYVWQIYHELAGVYTFPLCFTLIIFNSFKEWIG